MTPRPGGPFAISPRRPAGPRIRLDFASFPRHNPRPRSGQTTRPPARAPRPALPGDPEMSLTPRTARLALCALEDRATPATAVYSALTQTLTVTANEGDRLVVSGLAGKPTG